MTRAAEAVLPMAVERGATDVHIELHGGRLAVRERRAGALEPVLQLAGDQAGAWLRALKAAAGLDRADPGRPADGLLRLEVAGRTVECRASYVPTVDGESVVLRVLDRERLPPELADLGWRPDQLTVLRRALTQPHGLILAVGPTGAGKTTTLYALVRALATPERKIVAVEDPVEYPLAGVVQTDIRPETGWTCAEALRRMLRHDPDVILVGEIRDADTARMAARAALTGHLVLSSLHAADAAGARLRLGELGLDPWVWPAVMRLVIAQRLLPRACPHCAGAGCINCGTTGQAGRHAVFELTDPTDPDSYRETENRN
jgi:general secretion pathway protein E